MNLVDAKETKLVEMKVFLSAHTAVAMKANLKGISLERRLG